MKIALLGKIAASLALIAAPLSAAQANDVAFESAFDQAFGTQQRAPRAFVSDYADELTRQIATVADGSQGRIAEQLLGIDVVELAEGRVAPADDVLLLHGVPRVHGTSGHGEPILGINTSACTRSQGIRDVNTGPSCGLCDGLADPPARGLVDNLHTPIPTHRHILEPR